NPLTEAEQQRFEGMHFRQPYFGHMPFVLFADRFPFLHSVLFSIWEEGPDPTNLAVLYRLLDYYREMAVHRRAADQLRKARTKPAGQGQHLECAVTPEFLEGAAAGAQGRAPDPVAEERFAEIAEGVRRVRGVRCTCREPDWEDRAVTWDDGEAVLSHSCRACGLEAATTVTLE